MLADWHAAAPTVTLPSTRSWFVCRRRNITGMDSVQTALAHGGRIAPELRARSPVYYWQTTTQANSRHEAVCATKRGTWHLLTFGSHGRFSFLASRKCFWPDPTPSPANRFRRKPFGRVLDSCTNHSLETLPVEWMRAHNISTASRGIGYWKWKPYLILRHLESLAEGDVLAWLDYDLILSQDLSALFCLGQNAEQGVALFHFPCHVERAWTKRELAEAMGANDAMLNSVQVYGGMIVLRKCEAALAFVREWLKWTLQGTLATDDLDPARQHSDFVAHRHDQSIVSLLAKRRGIKTFPFPTRAHDVRDVWTWDAGYCTPDFNWPLPNHRPWNYYGYITHYLEMGHQYKAMMHCMETQRRVSAYPVPLPDYLESKEVLKQVRDERVLLRAQRRGRWTAEKLRRLQPQAWVQPLTALPYGKALVPIPRCVANETYGGFHFDGADHVWTSGGCRGAFRCDQLDVFCGRLGKAGRGLVLCRCTTVNTVEAIRHWNDGHL